MSIPTRITNKEVKNARHHPNAQPGQNIVIQAQSLKLFARR